MINTHVHYSMNVGSSGNLPVIENVMSLATVGAQNLSTLALSQTPAAVNFGIYTIINKFHKPSLIIFGTEAAVLLTLSCVQAEPISCLSSFINLDSLQAVSNIALENIGTGATYALGEEVARKALTLSIGNSSREIAQSVLNTLAASGLGFYAWSMDPSLSQAMLLSMCSAVVLTSLTAPSNQPVLKNIQQKIMSSLGSVSNKVGKIIGVAAVAAGAAAIAYQKTSSEALLGAVVNATTNIVSPSTLAAAQNMIRANYSWITSYRWVKNAFNTWNY